MPDRVDCVVIGAGVIGLAIARALAQAGREVIVLERERAIGMGTSSRNSEVIHAGIYYPTGSMKARLCLSGKYALHAYCQQREIPHRRTGKIIVATNHEELLVLEQYRLRAERNGVSDLCTLTATQIAELEPSIRCVGGLLSPSTGIVDSHALMLALQTDIEALGGVVVCGASVLGGRLSDGGIILETTDTPIVARSVVNAAGLDAQEISRRVGVSFDKIPPLFLAKGHYFTLSGTSPFSRLVYPVANEAGLGIHVTLDLAGKARFGPDVAWIAEIDYGFDLNRRAIFAAAIRRYYPDLDETLLQPAYTGIRPKLAGPMTPSADFCIRGPESHGGIPYVALYGMESPGLTASLAIAEEARTLLMPMETASKY